jgi:2-polyprenyl-3-methyl-5-hydroxy-6-metoxy-1,4-benzoquinol methylase
MTEAQSLELIDACKERVFADDTELTAWVADYHRKHRLRLAEDLRLVLRFAQPGATVIEFGSIPPILTLALKHAGFEVHGLDIAPERFATMIERVGLRIVKSDVEVERVPFEDGAADVVLFNEVFEHMRIDLIRTMTEVRRVLKPSGRLLLSTPNLRSLRGLVSLIRHHRSCHVCPDVFEEYGKLRRFGHMGHVREYTAREVRDFLANLGLQTDAVIYRGWHSPGRRSLFGRTKDAIEAACCLIMPSMKPLFSLVCRRSDIAEKVVRQ